MRRTLEELEQVKNDYSDLYEYAPVAYLTLNQSDTIIKANIAASTLLGVERRQLLRKRFTRFVAPEEANTFDFFRKNLLEAPGKQTCELKVVTPPGGPLYVRIIGEAVPGDRGGPQLWRAVLVDVTEHRHIEEEMDIKDVALASSLVAFVITDLEGRISYINSAGVSLLGSHSAQELIGKGFLEMSSSRDSTSTIVEQVRVSGRWTGEHTILKGDGTPVDILASVSMVKNQAGEAVRAIISLVDITERKIVEQMKDDLIGLVSHELRTPLTVIMGCLNTLTTEASYLPPGEKKQLEWDAAQETEALAHLIDNLIELSRAQDGRLSLFTEPVRVANQEYPGEHKAPVPLPRNHGRRSP